MKIKEIIKKAIQDAGFVFAADPGTRKEFNDFMTEALTSAHQAGYREKEKELDTANEILQVEAFKNGHRAGYREATEKINKKIDEMKLCDTDTGDGLEIERSAKKFGVPDSVMALRMFQLKKEELLSALLDNEG